MSINNWQYPGNVPRGMVVVYNLKTSIVIAYKGDQCHPDACRNLFLAIEVLLKFTNKIYYIDLNNIIIVNLMYVCCAHITICICITI